MNNKNVTIDGPAGAGKSTVAKKVADKLNYVYLDTGAMYRTLTYLALANNIDTGDENALARLAKTLNFRIEWGSEKQKIFCNDQDLTEKIRSPLVSNNVSMVAKHFKVREQMVILQRKIAANKGVVLDGRDTGTFVLPNAEYKFFLTASIEERAVRRANELAEKGYASELEEIKSQILSRDKLDSEREIAPLKIAPDAMVIDTSKLTVNEVIEIIIKIINKEKA